MNLRQNTQPIKAVPAAVRDVWASRPEHRCYHEDGRGRCRSYATHAHRFPVLGVEWYCRSHTPNGATPP